MRVQTPHCHLFVWLVEAGLVLLREELATSLVLLEAHCFYALHAARIVRRFLDGVEARVVTLHESVDRLAIVLLVELSDVVLLLVHQGAHFVVLDVEIGRVFVLDDVVVLQGQHSGVVGRRVLTPELNVVFQQG